MSRRNQRDNDDADVRGGGGAADFAGAVGVLLLVGLTVCWPLILVTAYVGYLLWDRRRVRVRWFAGLTVVAGIAALIISIAAGSGWLSWAVQAPVALWSRVASGIVTDVTGWFGDAAVAWTEQAHALPWSSVIARHLVVGVPVGLAVATLIAVLGNDGKRQSGRLEGRDYTNVRPVGWLDRRRAHRNLAHVASGGATTARLDGRGGFALGVGRYGHVVCAEQNAFKKAVLITGAPRTGKSRLTNSICDQITRLGGARIIIDFKADPSLTARAAELAHQENRAFYHVALASTAGGGYERPHPYAPARPATYDPLSRGNGASKAGMLLDSVEREGDAAAYKRAAHELVQLGTDVAHLARYDEDPQQRRGGLQVVSDILNLETLTSLVYSLTPQHVAYRFPHFTPGQHADLLRNLQDRVALLAGKIRGNQVVGGAIADTQSLLSRVLNSAATAGIMQPETHPGQGVDLVRAILRGDVVVFSLDVQMYREFATMFGNMVLLDLQNAVSVLRQQREAVSAITGISSATPDATPWQPVAVQVEEFGSGNNEVILGLLNKSSDEGLRVVMNTQAYADLVHVDGTGVWAQQIVAQLSNWYMYQANDEAGEKAATEFSGQVEKLRPTETIGVKKANVLGFGQRAQRAREARSTQALETRVEMGAIRNLPHNGAFFWVSKTKQPPAVHTVREGPNQWVEQITFAGARELPYGWNPWTELTAEEQEAAQLAGEDAYAAAARDLESNESLHRVLGAQQSAADDVVDLVHAAAAASESAAAGGRFVHPHLAGPTAPRPAAADSGQQQWTETPPPDEDEAPPPDDDAVDDDWVPRAAYPPDPPPAAPDSRNPPAGRQPERAHRGPREEENPPGGVPPVQLPPVRRRDDDPGDGFDLADF